MKPGVTLSRYLGGGIFAFVVPLFFAAAFSLWTLSAVFTDSLVRLNYMSAVAVSDRLEEFFNRVREALGHTEYLITFPRPFPSSVDGAYLAETLREFPFIRQIQLIGADGRVSRVVPDDPSLLGVSRAGERIYESVRSTGEVYWSESYVSSQTNKPAITFGVGSDGQVALLDLDLAWLGDYAGRIRVLAGHDIELRITDRNGAFVSHPRNEMVARRELQTDFPALRNAAGIPDPVQLREGETTWLASVAKISEPEWYILVMYPKHLLTSSLLGNYAQLSAFFLATMLAGVFFWRLRFRRVRKALGRVSTTADRISTGDYRSLFSFGESFQEFRLVAERMDAMVAAIAERERTLREREQGFRRILESIDLAAVSVTADGSIRYANPYLVRASGYAEKELAGKDFKSFLCARTSTCPFEAVLRGAVAVNLIESTIRLQNGQERIFYWSVVRDLDAAGRPAGATGIGHDMTELLLSKEQAERSLREKDILLKEVHHRVKNNLQIISSLLDLQKLEAAGDREATALSDAENRVYSISLVHEILYGSENFGAIDFRSYLESLAEQILSAQAAAGLNLRVTLSPFELSLTDAVPCALIVNEAIQNALKHAFPADWTAERLVELSGEMDIDRKVRIAVRDNGVGSGGAAKSGAKKGLGSVIMTVLAEQLGGTLRGKSDGGTSVEITFAARPLETASPGGRGPSRGAA